MSTDFDTLPLRLTEQLRDDLLRILTLAETTPEDAAQIAVQAKHSLRLADAWLLANQQTQLPLEPITAASVLEDVAHDIYQLAKTKGLSVQIDTRGSQQPILTHRQSMRDLMLLISTALLYRQQRGSDLVLGTHRSAYGTVAGVFGPAAEDINVRTMSSLQQTSSAEVLLSVAARLGARLQAQVKSHRHANVAGFGATFMQSRQLQLVV